MKILLTGASGFLGRHLDAALRAAGHSVVPVSRRHGVDMSRMLRPADWRAQLEGMDAAINAVGIIGQTPGQTFQTLHTDAPLALFEACAQAGVRRVVQISALGADHAALSAYHLSKRAADDVLRRLPLDAFVLRPSLIYGEGGTSARLFLRLARLPWLPVLEDGAQLIQPLHVGDVTATVLRALSSRKAGLTLDLVGPETLSFAAWLQRLRAAQGLGPAQLLHVPYRLALAAAALGQGLSPMLRTENLRMLKVGCVGDGRAWTAFLGRAATPASPTLLRAIDHSDQPVGRAA